MWIFLHVGKKDSKTIRCRPKGYRIIMKDTNAGDSSGHIPQFTHESKIYWPKGILVLHNKPDSFCILDLYTSFITRYR